eukprot:8662349-Pyramimonas_sp.AAC.2
MPTASLQAPGCNGSICSPKHQSAVPNHMHLYSWSPRARKEKGHVHTTQCACPVLRGHHSPQAGVGTRMTLSHLMVLRKASTAGSAVNIVVRVAM